MSGDAVYGAFLDYYGNLPLKRIKQDQNFSVYAYSVGSGTLDNRYIFVVVPNGTRPLPESTKLNNLDWVSFQTRSTQDHYPGIPSGQLMMSEDRKKALPDVINNIERTLEKSVYFTIELPVKITLIHDPKKNNTLQYPDTCKLYQALETYNCVVDLL